MNIVCPACGATNRVPDERLHDAPVCGRCKGALMATQPVELDDAHLSAFIAATELPVLVDFWAEWCGPCRMVAPFLEEIAKEYEGKLTVAKVNIDENPMTPNDYAVRGIPTMILFKDGKPVDTKVGALPRSALKDWVAGKLAG